MKLITIKHCKESGKDLSSPTFHPLARESQEFKISLKESTLFFTPGPSLYDRLIHLAALAETQIKSDLNLHRVKDLAPSRVWTRGCKTPLNDLNSICAAQGIGSVYSDIGQMQAQPSSIPRGHQFVIKID